VVGRGSKRALGRPVQAANVLDVSALSGIVSYEPAELVLTARAGTPMNEIEAALAEHGQCLAFEPPDLSALLNAGRELPAAQAADFPSRVGEAGAAPASEDRRELGAANFSAWSAVTTGGTLGGIVATGLSGPRRFKAGAVRDHVLGIAAVSGRGEAFVGGGKVVKNVTGYDIPKLMTGSYGTLAVLTEITVKVLPRAQDQTTVLLNGLSLRDAVRVMTGVLQSAVDVSGACHLPAGIDLPAMYPGVATTAFRLEGFTPSVESRLRSLCEHLQAEGASTTLDHEASVAFWYAVRDISPFVAASNGSVWRLSVPPAAAAEVAERIESVLPGAKMFLDWGGGLIWVATDAAAHAVRIRETLGETGGHATLIRAPALVRANVEVFQPQSSGVAALSKRVKTQFDPAGVLNPGRMYAPG
jgi:glycolate oxidase FAD binding subunit